MDGDTVIVFWVIYCNIHVVLHNKETYSMAMEKKTAAVIVIGNEILSGRTHDVNTNFIAKAMTAKGIQLTEARVVPDDFDLIIEAVNLMRERYDYVFTTGGIGPTHDDMTAEAIARAFGVKLVQHESAYQMLLDYYKDPALLNDARLKMTYLPEGSDMIINKVTGAPGFKIGNVYAMAGVPKIMQAMVESLLPSLAGGVKIYSISVTVNLVESQIADILQKLEEDNDGVEIGSYPSFKEGIGKVSAVIRGADKEKLEHVSKALQHAFIDLGGSILEVKEL